MRRAAKEALAARFFLWGYSCVGNRRGDVVGLLYRL